MKTRILLVLYCLILINFARSQTIIIGYSDLFTIGNKTYEYPNIFGYSGVFEMNTMGNYITGYSGLFMLNTIGAQITGIVTDQQTGEPIEGAVVKSLAYSSIPTDQAGEYTLFVPFGYGYTVHALANDYQTKYVYNVNVPQHSPEAVVNFELLFDPVEVELTLLNPNPNPVISTVQQGGYLHRYYQIVNSINGNPVAQKSVHVSGNGFSKDFPSNEDGIVDIKIHSSEIGDGQTNSSETFTIESLDGEPLAEAVEFMCEVVNPEYGKYWQTETFVKLGISFVKVDGKNGSFVKLIENNTSNQTSDNFSISRQAEGNIGVEFSVGVEAGVQCGQVQVGGNAKAGVGGNVAIITEDKYKYGRGPASNDFEAIGRYIQISEGSFDFIDQTLYNLLLLGEAHFNNQYNLLLAYQQDRKSIDVGVFGKAEAGIGIGATKSLGVGIDGNLGVEAHCKLDFVNNYAESEKEFATEFSGKFGVGAQAGLRMDLTGTDKSLKELKANLDVFNREFDRGIRFVFIKDLTKESEPLKEVTLTFIKRNVKTYTGYEEELSYTIAGEELVEAIENIQSIDLIGQLNNQPEGSVIEVAQGVFKNLVTEIFNICYNLQTNAQGEASIGFVKERTNIEHQETFEVSISGQLGASLLKAEIGGGKGFEEGLFYTSEKGKWVWGKHFILEENSGIGPFNDDYQTLMQDILDDIPTWLKILIGIVNVINPFDADSTIYYVGDQGSYIALDPAAIPMGIDSLTCTSWGWYGSRPGAMESELSEKEERFRNDFRKRAEKSFGMQYGYGGFYQLEPYGTDLLDTCWMAIVYDQAEVDSIDESSLGMYWEDKANHRWVYLGGILDTIENKVTAPISELSLFTLAPAMPYGEFGLHALPDSIYADSISTAIISSDTIFNNNLIPVSDGEKFTVATTYGKVITADADTTIDGIQVIAATHQIQFEVQSSHIGGKATISAFSVNGSANATTDLRYYDTIPPAAPVLAEAIPDSTTVELFWQNNTEDDLSGYVIYFDTDTIQPFDGIHTVYGQPSPIYIGTDTLRKVYGLFNDSTYYFTITAVDVEGNESDYSNFMQATPWAPVRQNIYLAEGWSGLSSYVLPETDNVVSVLESIFDELIILKNNSGMYWPSQNINTLVVWNTHDGYQIKVVDTVLLTITGIKETEKNLALSTGWNLIPVLSECAVDVEALFAGKDLVIVKEVAGWNLYWPEHGINTLGGLLPGKAYFVLMGSTGEITYPECVGLKGNLTGFQNLSGLETVQTPWQTTNPTSSTHSVALLMYSGAESLKPGDIIGAFDTEGNCSGMTVWKNEATAITLFGNDPTTNAKDGFDEGEPMQFKLYRPETGEEFSLDVIFDPYMPNPDPVFATNGLSAISELKVSSLSIGSAGVLPRVSIIPNPANDEFRLVIEDKDFEVGKLKIFSMDGRIAKTLLLNDINSLINISELRSGIYMLEIKYGVNSLTRRLAKY